MASQEEMESVHEDDQEETFDEHGDKKEEKVDLLSDEESEDEEDDDDDDDDEDDDEDDDGEDSSDGDEAEDGEEDGDEADGVEEGEDSEEEGEEDDEDEEEEEEEAAVLEAEVEAKESEESGGEECDNCPICLNRLRRQDVGTPESCDHVFCLECIQEWARNVNTCPVDRQIFRIILARHAGENKIFKQFPVEDRNQEDNEESDDPTYCEVCGQSDREDRLLLCDGCDLGYHCECLDPPLARVPVDEWFCPDCQLVRDNAQEGLSHQRRRQIARTQVSERVRRVIQGAREERAERRRRIAEMAEAQEDWDEDELLAGPSASATASSTPTTPRRKSTTPRKKTTRKKKTVKRKTTRKKRKTTKKKTTGKKTTRRKKKRKGKKRKKSTKGKKTATASAAAARTVRLPPPSSVKGRIADRLGLSKPPVGRSIPLQRTGSGTRLESGSSRSTDYTSTLSIMGSKDELYSFADQEGEERKPVSRPAIAAETLLSRSARSSHKPLSFITTKKKLEVKAPAAASTSTSGASSFDLLGSIMQNQDLLHKNSQHIKINRDGSLTAKSSDRSPKKQTSSSLSSSSSSPSTGTSSSSSSSSKLPTPAKTGSTTSGTTVNNSNSKSTGNSRRGSAAKNTVTEFEDGASSDDELAQLDAGSGLDLTQVKSESKSEVENATVKQEVDPPLFVKVEVKKEEAENEDQRTSGANRTVPHSNTSLVGVPHEMMDKHASQTNTAASMMPNGHGCRAVSVNGEGGHRENSSNRIENGRGDFSSAGHGPSRSTTETLNGNLDELVCAKGNLAGFESRQEGKGFKSQHHSCRDGEDDREEGEASDSGEEGEIKENHEGGGHFVDDQEEGEIVEEEDWAVGQRGCQDETEAGGLDVNAIHVEEMSIGTMRKRSSSNCEENVSKKKAKTNEEKVDKARYNYQNGEQVTEDNNYDNHDHVDDDEDSSDGEEYDPDKPTNGSFQVAMFLSSLKSKEFDRKVQRAKMKEERERKKQEEKAAAEESSKHKISILDFLGPASVRFGVVPEGSTARGNGRGGHISGRGRGRWDRGDFRNGGIGDQQGLNHNVEGRGDGIGLYQREMERRKRAESFVPHEASNYVPGKQRDHKKRWLQEERKGKHRSSSQDSKDHSQRSGSPDSGTSRSRWSDREKGRRQRGSESRDRSWSHSPPRKADKKRRRVVYEEDSEEDNRKRKSEYKKKRRKRVAEVKEELNSEGEECSDEEGLDGRSSKDANGHPPELKAAPVSPGQNFPKEGPPQPPPPPEDEPGTPPPPKGPPPSHAPPPPAPGYSSAFPHAQPPAHSQPYPAYTYPAYSVPAQGHPAAAYPPQGQPTVAYPQTQPTAAYTQGQPAATYPPQGQPAAAYPPQGQPAAAYPPQGQPAATYPPPSQPTPAYPPQGQSAAGHPYQGHPAPPHSGAPAPSYPAQGHYAHSYHPPGHHPTAHPAASHAHPVHSYRQPHVPQPRAQGPPRAAYPASYYRYPQPHPGTPATSRPPATQASAYPHYPAHPQHISAAAHRPAHPAYPAHSAQAVVHHPAQYPSTTVPSAAVYHRPPLPLTAPVTVAQRYAYPAVKTEPGPNPVAHGRAPVKTSSPEAHRTRDLPKKSQREEGLSIVRSTHRAPSPAPLRSIPTSDKLTSNFLLDEVKKGFRQLVEDAVRCALKSAWGNKKITKEEYKDIFKKAVEKVCGSKETVVHQEKIQSLIDAYVMKARKARTS